MPKNEVTLKQIKCAAAAAVQHTFFMVILPLVTWFVASVRGLGNKDAAAKQSAEKIREGAQGS